MFSKTCQKTCQSTGQTELDWKITKENKMSKETSVNYDGTKKFNDGGNSAKDTPESHDGPYAKGKKCGQEASISKKTN